MKKVLKIFEYIVYSFLGILLFLNVIIMIKTIANPNEIPGVFGYKPFVVMSGSMKPNIMIGDLIIVKRLDINTLEKNDIIAFRDDKNTVTTHRIVSVINSGSATCFITKGDSNNVKDSEPVCAEYIEGKYVRRFAKLGNLVLFVQQPLGFGILMLTVLFVGIIIFIIKNRQIDKEFEIKDQEEREAFEEFKRLRNESKKKK